MSWPWLEFRETGPGLERVLYHEYFFLCCHDCATKEIKGEPDDRLAQHWLTAVKVLWKQKDPLPSAGRGDSRKCQITPKWSKDVFAIWIKISEVYNYCKFLCFICSFVGSLSYNLVPRSLHACYCEGLELLGEQLHDGNTSAITFVHERLTKRPLKNRQFTTGNLWNLINNYYSKDAENLN